MKTICIAGMAVAAACAGVQADCTIAVGGTASSNLITALNNLGYAYTDYSPNYPAPGSAEVIIVGMDGGAEGPDYSAFLAGGGDLIVTGGSNYDPYRSWVSNYFTITDTGAGWHTDGAWTKTLNNVASQYMPNNYSPEDGSLTYHMLALASGTAYGVNAEGYNMGAIQDYANGGSFNYMAMDLGPYGTGNDVNNFTTPFLKGAIEYACTVPTPGAAGLFGVAGLVAARRRR